MNSPKSSLDLGALVGEDEGQYFERKSLWEGPPSSKRTRDRRTVRDEIADHVAAFANADGGTLVLGVEDDGRVTGCDHPDEAIAGFLEAPTARLQPPQGRGYIAQVEGKRVLVFEVEPAPMPVMVIGNGFPYRSDDSVVRMRESDIEAIKRRGLVESVEARVAGNNGIADLNLDLISRAQTGAGLANTPPEEYLVRRRLADQRGGRLVLRRAALLLFGRAPEFIDHPNAGVRIFRVRGTERRTGRDYNVEERPWSEGNLPAAFEHARAMLEGLIHKSARLHDLFFRESPEYPTLAWQEALVNALAHRDYAIEGTCVDGHRDPRKSDRRGRGRVSGGEKFAVVAGRA